MQKRYVYLTLFALLLPFLSFTQNTLAIHNPQIPLWWGAEDFLDLGDIKEASITMRPQGLYAEVELEMTIGPAYETNYWEPDDSLEIVYHFELPTGSIVYDSYLWIDGAKVQAFVLERSYGVSIYESIVDRQQDPSVLMKNRDGKFELRVYPLRADETRTLEIDYLVPITWHDGMAGAELPVEVLRAGSAPDLPLTIRLEPNELAQQFTSNNPMLELTASGAQELTVPLNQLQVGNMIQWPMPLQDGAWVNVDQAQKKYQLLFDPSEHLPQSDAGRNVVLCIAHQDQASQLSEEELRHLLIEGIEQYSRPNDRYAIITTNDPISITWPESSLLSPEAAIQYLLFADLSIPDQQDPQYEDHLVRAVELIQEYTAQPSHILQVYGLPTSVYTFHHPYQAVYALYNATVPSPIHIWQTSEIVPSIEYDPSPFFDRLTITTSVAGGSFLAYGSHREKLAGIFLSMEENDAFLELELTPQNGFNYQRYRIGHHQSEHLLNTPIMEVGKYAGEGQLEFQANVLMNDIPMVINLALGIDTNPAAALHRIWVGNKLAYQEKLVETNDEVNDIVQESIQERILTLYTIMLCLDPAIVTIEDECPECPDENEPVVNTDEVEAAQAWSARILENPSRGHLRLQWEGAPPAGQVVISIFNTNGAQLMQRDLGDQFQENEVFFDWNLSLAEGKDLAAGIYLVQIRTEAGIQTLRWVVIQ